ncbi:MAG: ATP phosphoribosyltransferase regulatory subunit, partial [Clostridia bacterium]|nr:ATP phosphoribosyltransferase regulatory subunit [Clostridia bacterium]
GLLAPIFKGLGISEAAKDELLQCIAEKNAHGINEVAAREKAAPGALSKLRALLACGGALETAIPALERVLPECREQIARLSCIKDVLGEKRAKKVRLDFSVVNDMSYYNGIVFKGFINGVPAGVLSGGQYDGMMQKMGRSSKAIGFAVYLDLLERFGITAPEYDVDAVILYDDACDAVKLFRAAQQLICENKRVTVLKKLPEDLKYKQLLCMKEGEVCVLETNA